MPTCFHTTYNYHYFSLLGVPEDVNEGNDDQLRNLNRYKYLKKIEKTTPKDDHEYSKLIQEKHKEALNPDAETSTIPYEITKDGYKCTLCDKVYLHQQSFKRHFDRDHPRTGRSYKCGLCGQFFQSFQKFHDHMLRHKKESRKGQRYQISSDIKIAAVRGNIRESIKIPTEKVLDFHRKISNPKPTLVSLEKRDGTMVKLKEDGSTVTVLQQRLTNSNIVLDKNLIMIVPQNVSNSLINPSEDQNVQQNSKITTIINPEVQRNDSSSQIIKIKPPNQINNEAVNQSTSIGKSIQINSMPITQDVFDTVRTGGIQNTAVPILDEKERENRNASPVTSSSGADNSNRWSTTWCGHKSSFKKPPRKQGEMPKMFPLLSKKNQKDSELPLQIKSVQSLYDKAVISSKEGNPENDIGESDMQIQITSVQGNVGKLYQNHKDLLAKDDAIKANPIEIEGIKNAILQIKQQKTNKQTNQAIFKSNRFTDEQILNIIDEYTEQVDHISVIANKYGVHISTIRNWIEKSYSVNNPVASKKMQLKRKRAARENKDKPLEHGDFDSESTSSATELDIEDFESTTIKQEPEDQATDPFSNDFISCDPISEEITDQITEEITDQISDDDTSDRISAQNSTETGRGQINQLQEIDFDPIAVNAGDLDVEPARTSPAENCTRIFEGLFPQVPRKRMLLPQVPRGTRVHLLQETSSQSNSPGPSADSLNPTLDATEGVSVPQTSKRQAKDFTEDEKAAIVDECTFELYYNPTLLAEKYNINVADIRLWVKEAGKFLPQNKGGVSDPQTSKRQAKDFTEDEKAAIVDKCTVELYSPTLLAEKYDIHVAEIRRWVKAAGKFLPQKYIHNATNQLTKQPYLRTLSSDQSMPTTDNNIDVESVRKTPAEKRIRISEGQIPAPVRNATGPSTHSLNPNLVATGEVSVPQTSKKQAEDFTEDEKAAIVDECTVELYSPILLAEKYNIDYYVIRQWVKEAGKFLPQNYKYKATTKQPQQPYLRTLASDQSMPTTDKNIDLESVRKTPAEKRIRISEGLFPEPVRNAPGPSTNSLNPTSVAAGGVSVPQTSKRQAEDFTEDEKAAIVDECTVELYSPTLLAEKYNIDYYVIRRWIKEAGKLLPKTYLYNAPYQPMTPTDNKCHFCPYEDPPKVNTVGPNRPRGWLGPNGGWLGLNLNDHMFKAHKHCKECNTTFKTRINIVEHIYNKHNFISECEFCNFIVYDKSLMSQHLEKHGKAVAKKPKTVEQSEESQYSVEIKCKTCKVKKGFGRRILMQHHCEAHNFCLDCEVEFDDTFSALGKDLFRNGWNTSPNFIF